MCTYSYRDELGNEITVSISKEVHELVADEFAFENRLRQEHKRHITDLPLDRYEALPSRENVAETAAVLSDLHDVFSVVNGCTEKQRRRFLLHVVYGLKAYEIARLEGCSYQTVCNSLRRVMRAIMTNM